MMEQKDIKFTEKKIDENWKEQTSREKDTFGKPYTSQSPESPAAKTSKHFLNLLTSLGLQAMMHLGEIPNPETKSKEQNLEAAREIIDLLAALREKTQEKLSSEEKEVLESIIPELQMKFAQRV